MPILRKDGKNLRAPIIGNAKPKNTSLPVAANDEKVHIAFTPREFTYTVLAALVLCLLILAALDWWAVQILFKGGN